MFPTILDWVDIKDAATSYYERRKLKLEIGGKRRRLNVQVVLIKLETLTRCALARPAHALLCSPPFFRRALLQINFSVCDGRTLSQLGMQSDIQD